MIKRSNLPKEYIDILCLYRVGSTKFTKKIKNLSSCSFDITNEKVNEIESKMKTVFSTAPP